MKFVANTKEFQEALKKVEYCINKKYALPILKSILITAGVEEVTLTSTNIDNIVKVRLSANIIESGSIILDVDTVKIIKKLKCDTIIFADSEIMAGKRTIKFNPADAEEFPKCDFKGEELFTIDNMRELLKMTYASGYDSTRPLYNSVVINNDDLVTTDTHRLALRKLPFDTGLNNVIVNIDAINLIRKTLDKKEKDSFRVAMSQDGKFISFRNDKTKIIGRIVEGKFPDYKQVIPNENFDITVSKSRLLEELTFLYEVSRYSKHKETIFDITEDNVKLTAENEKNTVNAKIDIVNDYGENMVIAFNTKYLLDTLKNYESEDLIIEFGKNELCPMVIKEDGKLDLILPVRLPTDHRKTA